MQATTIGLDLAKNVFQVHGVDAEGRVVMRRKLRHQNVLTYFGVWSVETSPPITPPS
jgi:transposase